MKNLCLIISLLILSVLSQNTVDYWVDLTNTGARVSIGAADFGRDGQLSVSWVVKLGSTSGWRQIFHSFSNLVNDGADNLRLGVAIGNGNTFGLYLGTKFYSWTMNSGITAGVSTAMTLDLLSTPSGVTVTVFKDNAMVMQVLIPNESIGAGIRVNTILGAYRYSNGGAANYIGTGAPENPTYLDNFIILNKVSTAAFRNSLTMPLWKPTVDIADTIRLWLSFDDTVSGVGDTTVAVTSASGEEALWINAEFLNGAVFKQHVEESLAYCYGWGDPHIYFFGGGSFYPTGEQLQGHYLMVGCDEADYEVRTYTRYTQWWRATVYRSFAVRYRETIVRFNLDELNAYGGDPPLGQPMGAQYKSLHETAWSTLPGTNGYLVYFKGLYYSTVGTTHVVNVPGIGKISVSSPDSRYFNIDTWFNTLNSNCPRTGTPASDGRGYVGAEGYCYGDVTYRRVDYEDWLPPPPLQDINIPNNPCQDLDTGIVTSIQNACKRIYPTNAERYGDCVTDGCLTGDPEVIPLSTPTPECQVARLTGQQGSCVDLDCPNQCSYRGTCSSGSCQCDNGWVGPDCGQPKYFPCQSFSYGDIESYINPYPMLSTPSASLEAQFNFLGIERSVLFYTVTLNSMNYLFVVASKIDSPYAGSFKLCFNSPITRHSIQKINVAENAGCYDVSFAPYQQGGIIFELGSGPTPATFTIGVTNRVNIEQVLFGSANGIKEIEIAKIPNSQTGSFIFKVNRCDSEICANYEKCSECSAQPQCGYCVENNRCMLGTATGPFRGSCKNWRFTFDETLSRVVTVEYNGIDLVDPDYEIFLTSSSSNGVSTSLIVPTGSSNNQWDIAFFFQTTGSYPVYASSLKNSLMKTIESGSFTSMSINLAIGIYDESTVRATQSLTRLSTNNHYVFARALETATGDGTDKTGGQVGALGYISGSSQTDLGFRKYSKKLAVITAYDVPSAADEAKLANTKQYLIKSNILPVIVALGAKADVVEAYFRNLPNLPTGFPCVVIRMDEAGSNFATVFKRILELGSSVPYIALDIVNDDLVHLDQAIVNANLDILYFTGLTHTSTRAKFILPMKRGDGNHHKAKIRVPGYGEATIVDVSNGKPSGASETFYGDESSPCIPFTLKATIFKNLVPPTFKILTAPSVGTLHIYNSNMPGATGTQVTAGSLQSKNTYCYKPPIHEYSYPVGSPFTSFTYSVTDGCSESEPYLINIVVNAVPEPPVSSNYNFQYYEGDTLQNFTIEAFEYDRDLVTNVNEKVTFTYSHIDSLIKPDLFSQVNTKASLVIQSTLTPVSFTTPYGPLSTTNNRVTQDLSYVYPSADFFGTINYGFTVSDGNLKNSYKISIDVVPINDDPVALFEPIYATNEDTPLNVTLRGFDVDNTKLTLTYKIISLQQSGSGSTIKNGRTGAILNINEEYTYTQTQSHSVEVPLTLTPKADDNNCPTGTPFASCPGSYAVIQFKVNDNNKEWRPNKIDPTPVAAETSWQTVTLHVIAVNDRPKTPTDKVLNLVEDSLESVMTLTAEDIDTGSSDLDVFVEHVPSYKSLHIFQRLSGGARGAEITSDGTELNDFTKKRFSQDHGLIVLPDANVHGAHKDNNFLFDSFTFYSFDGELRSDPAVVRVNIRPVNDAPVPIASVSFMEDNNYTLTFESGDVDNAENELNYTITALPDLSVSEEGVYVYFVANGDWKLLSTADLPFLVPRVNGRATVILSPRLNWFGTTKLTYTTVDTDNYLAPGDTGYKVNNVAQELTITVNPVNDAPVIKVASPIGSEDTPIVISLAGDDDAWGEDDKLEAIIESELYDGNGRTDINLGKLYFYTSALYNQLVADINNVNGAVEVHVGSKVNETNEYKVIYCPRQHKNTDTSLAHLRMAPWFKYKVHERESANEPKGLSSPVGSVKIVVNSVNDAPVAWGNTWSTVSEYDDVYNIYAGVWNNPSSPASGSQTDICYDNCFYFEDFDLKYPSTPAHRGIYMGGQDIELSDLSVVIVDAHCPDTIEIFYVEADGTEKQIKNSELKGWRYTQTVAPGTLRSVLQFRPAMDDFNAENPSENRGGRATEGGHKGESYCTITYEVRDQDDVPSVETKTITITVMQKNDIPREKLNRPQDNSNNGAQLDMNNFAINNVIGFEDTPVFIKLDAYDVEGDDFTAKIFDCLEGRGKFYVPSVDQHTKINSNGELELSATDPFDAFSTEPVDCVAARTGFVTLPTTFSQTQKKGWYMLFVPDPNDNSVNYNKLSLIYDDGISPVNTIYGTFRFITILPVNDAPEIWIKSPENGSSIPISYDDNSRIIIDPLTFKDDLHVDGTENLGTIIDTPFNFELNFKDADALDSPHVDFEIKITKRPEREEEGQEEFGHFEGFANVTGAIIKRDVIQWTSTIEQANLYVAGLAFVADKQGEYTMTVTVKDNGFTGRYCPPGPGFSLGQRSCPRTSVATFTITAYVNTAMIAGVATGVGGGIVALAAIGAILGAKFLKPKDTDAWTEWDVDNFGDVALPNPLFKGETVTGTSQIYQNQ